MTTDTVARPGVTYREVFAVREWRALWIAQVVSIGGDQFAAIALAVLIYQRTRSPLLAAVTFAVTTGAQCAGGLLLGWAADAYPRRAVMLTADAACAALVLLMLVPGVPLAGLLVLLAAVSLAVEPFLAARMATNAVVLDAERTPDLFQRGQAVTVATYQAAQFAGFAAGGVVTATFGVRAALAVDAASFAGSALLVRFGVRSRPAAGEHDGKPHVLAGARAIFARPVAAVALGLLCMAGFFAAPQGVMVPLGAQLGGTAATGWLLGAMFAGGTAGPLIYARLGRDLRMRLLPVVATAACAVLVLFAFTPPLGAALAILAVSGLCTGYIPAAFGALAAVVPDDRRGAASGVVGAGMAASQGVLIVAAGAVAARVSPALVVAACGVAGAACGVPLTLAWRRVRKGGSDA
jgi:MFS family permease